MIQALLASLIAAAPDDPRLTVTLREGTAGEAAGRPVLLCAGETSLPDLTRIDLRIYFNEPRLMIEMGHQAVLVREGRFAATFSPYTPPRNLAGLHCVRAIFEPHLQKTEPVGVNRIEAEARLTIGGPEDAERDRRAWGQKLVGEIEAIAAFAEEAEARYLRDKAAGKHDGAEWQRFVRDADDRTLEILRRAVRVPEYKALQFGTACAEGLEEFRDLTMHCITSCVRVLNNPGHPHGAAVLREGRLLLKRNKQRLIWSVFPPKGDGPLLTRLGEEALKILKDALEADAAGRTRARTQFHEALMTLDHRAPGTFHEAIIGLAAEAGPFFQALGSDGERARALLEGLERQFRELLEDFQRLR